MAGPLSQEATVPEPKVEREAIKGQGEEMYMDDTPPQNPKFGGFFQKLMDKIPALAVPEKVDQEVRARACML